VGAPRTTECNPAHSQPANQPASEEVITWTGGREGVEVERETVTIAASKHDVDRRRTVMEELMKSDDDVDDRLSSRDSAMCV